LSSLPDFLELGGGYLFRTRKENDPLGFAAEFEPHQHGKGIAPMHPIVPQDVAVVEDLNLSCSELVVGHINVADELTPIPSKEVIANGATWNFEIEHN
jgi:hypothetical protein